MGGSARISVADASCHLRRAIPNGSLARTCKGPKRTMPRLEGTKEYATDVDPPDKLKETVKLS